MKIKEGSLITALDNNHVYEVEEYGNRVYYNELGSLEHGFYVYKNELNLHFRETSDDDIVKLLDKRLRKNLIDNEVESLRLELEAAE